MKIIRIEDAKEWPGSEPFTPEQEKEALALAKAAFTADDLQKFTELGPDIPMEEFLADIEKAQHEKEDAEARRRKDAS